MCTRSTPCANPWCNVAWGRIACLIRAEVTRRGWLNPEDADDLTQAILLALLLRIKPGETPDDLRGLAVCVARRSRCSWFRRRERERLWREWFGKSFPESDVAPADDRFGQDLLDGIDLVASDAREVVIDIFVEGLSLKKTAKKHGCSEHRIRKQRDEAVHALDRLWGISGEDFLPRRAR